MDEENKIIEEEVFPLKFFDRILGIFFSPVKVMKNIKEYPKIGAALFVALVFAGLGGVYAVDIANIALEEQSMIYIERYGPDYMSLTEAAQEYTSNETLTTITTVATLLITPFVMAFVLSLLLLLITKIFRGEARFTQYFSMFFHIYILTNLIGLIPTVFMVMNQSSVNILSLAVLMPGGNITMPLYNLLASVHVQGVIEALLILAGVKVFNEWKLPKSFAVTFINYVIVVAAAVLIQYASILVMDWSFGMISTISF